MAEPLDLSYEDEQLFGLHLALDDWVGHLRSQLEGPRENRFLGEYQIVKEVGRGSQGVVYRAIQPGTQREVALKFVSGGHQAGESSHRRLAREVEIAATLDHPYVVTVHGFETIGEHSILVMEWVDGRSLDQWIREEHPSTQTRIELFLQLADGLHHAHSHGVLHRDLKPSNVLVDRSGRPRIVDFGLALLEDCDTRLTRSTELGFVGTLAYASPEQLEESSPLDARSDQYSLAVLLFELLADRRPFQDIQGLAALARATSESRAPLLSAVMTNERASRLPGGFRDLSLIIAKALERSPASRYSSVSAFAEDVERWRRGFAVLARRPRTTYLLSKWAQRNRLLAGTLLLFVGFLISFAAVITVQNSRVEQQRQEALAGWSAESTARQRALDAQREAEEARTAALALAESERESRRLAEELREIAVASEAAAVASEGRARSEAAAADEMVEILLEIFLAARPSDRSPGSMTVGEVLDAASARIDTNFANDPLANVRLTITMARVQGWLGRTKIARDLSERAVSQCLEIADAPVAVVAQARREFARQLFNLGDYQLSATQLELAESLLSGRESTALERIAQWTLESKQALFQGELKRAEALLLESLELARALDPPSSRVERLIRSDLGFVVVLLGRFADAETWYRSALDVEPAEGENGSAAFAGVMAGLANALVRQGKLTEPEELLTRALSIQEARFGKEHPKLAPTLASLAQLKIRLDDPAAAGPLIQRVVSITRTFSSSDQAALVNAIGLQANFERSRGNLEVAWELYEEGFHKAREHFGQAHVTTLGLALNTGLVLLELEETEESLDLFEEYTPIAREALGLRHPIVAGMIANLGGVRSRVGRFDEALAVLNEAMTKLGRFPSSEDMFVGLLGMRAEVHWEQGDRSKARADALEVRRRLKSCSDPAAGWWPHARDSADRVFEFLEEESLR